MTKLLIIRIRGDAGISENIKHTLYLMRLRKRLVGVILEKNKENLGMIQKVKDYVAFGEINVETLKQILLKRGKLIGDKPIEIGGKAIDEFISKFLENKSKFEDIKIKPFFRLHPPRSGFKKSVRLHYPKGILGYHGDKINNLVMKML